MSMSEDRAQLHDSEEANDGSLPSLTAMTRRQMVTVAGVSLVATTMATSGCTSLGLPLFPRLETGSVQPNSIAGVPVGTLAGGMRPIFVAPAGSLDPVSHSVADTIFWGEQLMEHAMFFAMLMPGAELAGPRAEAERFQRQFADHLALLRRSRMDRSNYVAFNNRTLSLASGLIDYKARMEQAQTSGRIRSLVWPTFFDHTRNEAVRFTNRLRQLNSGNTAFDRREVVPFWADKMEEHALFVSHLLDPTEKTLKKVAETAAGTFDKLEDVPTPGKGAAMTAAQTIIDFKAAAERGILAGQIKSIINPALADHVLREAIRFKDELTRAP